jgi:putative oxidoreductase
VTAGVMFSSSEVANLAAYDSALLVLRLVLGLVMAAHGCNKLFGAGGIDGTARWFDSIGMKPGVFHARMASYSEIVAGVCLAAGLLTPLAAAAFVALMAVAAWTVHRGNGFFIVKDGWEYNLVLAVSAVAVSGTGAGRFSLDYLVFRDFPVWHLLHGWAGLGIALLLGLTGCMAMLVIFFRPPPPPPV